MSRKKSLKPKVARSTSIFDECDVPAKKIRVSTEADSSSSSSDEFETAPSNLNELEDFKAIKPKNSRRIVDSSDSEDETFNKPTQFYDFTEIINNQTQLKELAHKAEQIKDNVGTDSNQEPDELSVSRLLAMGETCQDESESDEDSEKEVEKPKNIEISIQLPNLIRPPPKKSTGIDILKTEYNKKRKKLQISMHKVNLLCLLSHGFYLNSVINDTTNLALALSILPNQSFFPPEKPKISFFEKSVKWFTKKIQVEDIKKENENLNESIASNFSTMKANSYTNLVLMFVCLMRALGLKCRLLVSLQPISKTPPVSDLMRAEKKKETKTEPKASTSKKEKSKKKSKNRKVLSSDDEDDKPGPSGKKTKKGLDYWAEIYLDGEKRWLSVDVVREDVDCVKQIAAGCTKPMAYVTAWNEDNTIKDVTQRYAADWLTSTKKQRVDEKWWEDSLKPWKTKNNKLDRLENEAMNKLIAEAPFPAKISEYKNHPHFALKRHLLKFEAIYPPDAIPLGYLPKNKEPIYSRVCVTELYSRLVWMRQGKVVRLKEEPYKLVKSRPKYDKVTGKNMKEDIPLELFGYWQVEDYIAPPAVDGKVPRNEYGNVELYKPSMLPPGTVHLQLPNLLRVANKLNIDCAQAVTGWEFSGGGSHPIFDGYIVCEEFKTKLLDEWNKDFDATVERSKSKVEKRVHSNWRKLIRCVLLREKLQKKYNFNFDKDNEKKPEPEQS